MFSYRPIYWVNDLTKVLDRNWKQLALQFDSEAGVDQ